MISSFDNIRDNLPSFFSNSRSSSGPGHPEAADVTRTAPLSY